ncbi:helix-turn-helix domain-containing protein [Humibacter ginsenosidimutans]|uniref:Helix-turn-helix transcriptional regulator n=1 Tax=Humibacter ginsenosidimutans TaxID=2599293 RepID=A0A5B8M1V2_9MICO|nr:helix-turn-helix transcriptional regulator [Humibacter ginsenosidimutans]QDZ14021.1 helix-turn-helix transcriptional regulator [Humibacter ginsenosidimutans]
MSELDRSYVGGIERGERNVGLDNIYRVAEALGVEPAELFADPGRGAADQSVADHPRAG